MLRRILAPARPALAAAAAIVALSGAAPLPAPANTPVAAVAREAQILLEFNYYSDAARTNLVGRAVEYCDGTYVVTWGVVTNYQRVYAYTCPY